MGNWVNAAKYSGTEEVERNTETVTSIPIL